MAAATFAPLRSPFLCLTRSTSFARTSTQSQSRILARRNRLFMPTYSAQAKPVLDTNSAKHASEIIASSPHRPRFWEKSTLASASGTSTPRLDSRTSRVTSTAEALPPYQPPTSGLISFLPSSWIPYAELVRLDKPTGTYYLFMPCLFSTILAAPLTSPITPPSTVLSTSALFLLGAFIMRGAGCTINDLWDRNLDPRVARTRLRPIARGAVTVQQAIPFLGVQLLAGLGVLLSLPTQCLWYGIPSLVLVTTYPLAKRVTNYPQIVLGLTFSWGAFMGFPALGIDLLSPENATTMLSAACLYASCVAWTVVYDMIYAYQDIRDDAAAGIKSIALAQESRAKAFLATVAVVQVTLLAGAGVMAGVGPTFFVGSCGGAAMTLGYMIKTVDLSIVADCWRWFKNSVWITGGVIVIGLTGEYGMRYMSPEDAQTIKAG